MKNSVKLPKNWTRNILTKKENYECNLTNLFSVGDTIKLYKNGEQDIELVITSVDSYSIRFNTNLSIFGNRGIKKGSNNFKVIPNNKLDGNTLINLQDEFGNTTNNLFYRIKLQTTDSTKTPIINTVDFLK